MAEVLQQFLPPPEGRGLGAPMPETGPITLVEPTTEALAEGLQHCLQENWQDSELPRLSERVLREYAWARVAQEYEAVFAGVQGPQAGV